MLKIIPEIILASQSNSRKILLQRLGIDFTIKPAHIDETALPGEAGFDLVERLSKSKALAIAQSMPERKPEDPYLIIASDQVAVVDGLIYGKPGDFERGFTQLKTFSGKTIKFITGLCIVNNFSTEDQKLIYTYELSKVRLKHLTDEQIKQYLLKDQPYEAAASLKIESLGLSLIQSISTSDYNAIIGLPMLKLLNIFQQINIDILDI